MSCERASRIFNCWLHRLNYSYALKRVQASLILLLLFTCFFIPFCVPLVASDEEPVLPEPPVACFTWNPENPHTNQLIQFDCSCSYIPDQYHSYRPPAQNSNGATQDDEGKVDDSSESKTEGGSDSQPKTDGTDPDFDPVTSCQQADDGAQSLSMPGSETLTIVSYLWDFDDTTISTEQAPTHVYAIPQDYHVSLTITDDRGLSNTTTNTITVTSSSSSELIAIIDSITPNPAQPNEPVTFTGHGYTENGSIIAYHWHSSISGNLSDQPLFTTASLPAGTHHITFTVMNTTHDWSTPAQTTLIINRPPLPRHGGPYFGWLNEPLTFDGSLSADADGFITTYSWSCGDGTTAQGKTPDHIYTHIGLYTVTLTVTDNTGATATSTTVARIVGNPPHANTSGPYFGYMNESIMFNASQSYDIDGTIVSYLWDFGDNTTSTNQTTPHIYPQKGNYTITLTVVDNDGEYDTDQTVAVVVESLPPTTPHLTGPATGEPGQEYEFHVVSTDPEETKISYVFDWGDCTTFDSPFFPSATLLTVTHYWESPGTYSVSVTAYDESTQHSTAAILTLTITPKNQPQGINADSGVTSLVWMLLACVCTAVLICLVFLIGTQK